MQTMSNADNDADTNADNSNAMQTMDDNADGEQRRKQWRRHPDNGQRCRRRRRSRRCQQCNKYNKVMQQRDVTTSRKSSMGVLMLVQ